MGRFHAGLRRSLFPCSAPHRRFARAGATATASSRHATHALDALGALRPAPPRFILSDNGSECLGHFQQCLDDYDITHWGTYPRSPNTNAHAERFNRTLQATFVAFHEDWLFDDLAVFNQKLADGLLADNTVLPDQSLGRQSPGLFLLHHQPEGQRRGAIQQMSTQSRNVLLSLSFRRKSVAREAGEAVSATDGPGPVCSEGGGVGPAECWRAGARAFFRSPPG